ncbi:protein phosphatase 1 regulatory subunit 12C-like [Bacillus rossius redtenbacheri]|uniref:protein phosphatase 1 regulatory subunit 12C-like n=1 Tax=Bacillus rossius redtenbacheri TaxID=93214 RepID=UPI002FDE0713
MTQISVLFVSFLVVHATADILDREKLLEYNQTKNWVTLHSYLSEALVGTNPMAYEQVQAISRYVTNPMYLIGWRGYNYLAEELAIPEGCADITDSSGYAMLHGAAVSNDVITASLQLARGADSELTDSEGNTAMILAAQCNYLPQVQYLTQRGANVNAANHRGQTPLWWATYNRNWLMVKWLWEHEAVALSGPLLLDLTQSANGTQAVKQLCMTPNNPAHV